MKCINSDATHATTNLRIVQRFIGFETSHAVSRNSFSSHSLLLLRHPMMHLSLSSRFVYKPVLPSQKNNILQLLFSLPLSLAPDFDPCSSCSNLWVCFSSIRLSHSYYNKEKEIGGSGQERRGEMAATWRVLE